MSQAVRLTELLAVLSLGADLGLNQPMEHVIRQSLLAERLGTLAGVGEPERGVVHYASLLAWVGCHVDAYEQAKWFGDEHAFKGDARDVDLGSPVGSAGYVMRHLGAGRPLRERVALGARLPGEGVRVLTSMFDNHWRAAAALVDRLGLGEEVRAAVAQTFERWDGKGVPEGVRGEEILISSRLVNLSDVVEVFHARSGVESAVEVARARSGTQFDPALVDLFCTEAEELFAELAEVHSWDAALALTPPGVERLLEGEELEEALVAVADFVDLKSPYTIGHSRAVASLAGQAAASVGLTDAEVRAVRQAGLVHDLGRLGVSNSVWDKAGPLTPVERERVRLHPYLTERMLASVPALASLGTIAVQHHERLDGSGYPRGARGEAVSRAGRILGAADTYQSWTEPRPYRPARSSDDAAAGLRAEVHAGRLDGDAVEAVLAAAGHKASRRRAWPAGLSTREVEVLRLVACGLSYREIARELSISPKTASNHVERVYAKIGARNRAMAGLFAAQHGLMSDAD